MKILALLPVLAATGAHGRLASPTANVVPDRRLQFGEAAGCLTSGGDLTSCCPAGGDDPICSLLTCANLQKFSSQDGLNVNVGCTCEERENSYVLKYAAKVADVESLIRRRHGD